MSGIPRTGGVDAPAVSCYISSNRSPTAGAPEFGRRRGRATGVELTILGSGSAGNLAFLSTERTRLLIDAGLSKRETLKRMETAGLRPNGLAGIVVSHEHNDHAAHLGALAEEFNAPVYLAEGTREALPEARVLPRVERFRPGHRFVVGDIEMVPFAVPHDANEPVAFRVETQGVKLVLAVDLGFLTGLVKQQLRGCDCLILEANHDTEMLRRGPYPWFIKQRVMSRLGHLSNEAVADFLECDFDGSAAYLVLAHLSQNNNSPEIARLAAEQALERRRARFPLSLVRDPEIRVAPRRAPLAPLRF
ncbi:MBL fold metallo-hydrolase [Acidobacteriia bacterium AH_259_A11_L15]|nr:MBL fold metallo-hydrolase [Acidobacteriia bacterium AH_259_A11_L15]